MHIVSACMVEPTTRCNLCVFLSSFATLPAFPFAVSQLAALVASPPHHNHYAEPTAPRAVLYVWGSEDATHW